MTTDTLDKTACFCVVILSDYYAVLCQVVMELESPVVLVRYQIKQTGLSVCVFAC